MMVSGQISSTPASSPLPSPTPHQSPIIQQLPFSLLVVFCTGAVILRIAAIAQKAPPSPEDLLGYYLVPWLWARVRLRRKHRHQISAVPFRTDSHRDPPRLPPDHDSVSSGLLSLARFPIWLLQMSAWPDLDQGLKVASRSVPMKSGEVLLLPQLRQIEPLGSYTQAEEASRTVDQPVPLSRAGQPSRAKFLDQPAEPSQAFISFKVCPSQALFGVREQVSKTRYNTRLDLRDVVDEALHFEPVTYS